MAEEGAERCVSLSVLKKYGDLLASERPKSYSKGVCIADKAPSTQRHYAAKLRREHKTQTTLLEAGFSEDASERLSDER